jgi:hypothetical protein
LEKKDPDKRISQKLQAKIGEERTWKKNHKRNATKTLEKEEPNCCNLTEIAAKDWISRKIRTMPWIWRAYVPFTYRKLPFTLED